MDNRITKYPISPIHSNIERWKKEYIPDLLTKKESMLYRKWMNRYCWLNSMWKWTTHALLSTLFNVLWVSINSNFLKSISSNSPRIRKIIKDRNKEVLELLDSPEFLFQYVYLLSLFNIGRKNKISKNSINCYENYAWTIYQLLTNDKIETETFFCAHRKESSVELNTLVKEINIDAFNRIRWWLHGIVNNWPRNIESQINYYSLDWTSIWVNSIFPNIFINHFSQWKLWDIVWVLKSQKHQIEQNSTSPIEKNMTTDAFQNKVNNYLLEYYWDTRSEIDLNQLKKLAQHDSLANIWLNYAFPNLLRFWKEVEKYKHSLSKKDLLRITNLNINNCPNIHDKEIIELSIKKFLKWKSTASIALSECVFNYIWWNECKANNKIAFWFDRDHHQYQTESFHLWYWSRISPILYARRTGKKIESEISKLSYRQFWYQSIF